MDRVLSLEDLLDAVLHQLGAPPVAVARTCTAWRTAWRRAQDRRLCFARSFSLPCSVNAISGVAGKLYLAQHGQVAIRDGAGNMADDIKLESLGCDPVDIISLTRGSNSALYVLVSRTCHSPKPWTRRRYIEQHDVAEGTLTKRIEDPRIDDGSAGVRGDEKLAYGADRLYALVYGADGLYALLVFDASLEWVETFASVCDGRVLDLVFHRRQLFAVSDQEWPNGKRVGTALSIISLKGERLRSIALGDFQPGSMTSDGEFLYLLEENDADAANEGVFASQRIREINHEGEVREEITSADLPDESTTYSFVDHDDDPPERVTVRSHMCGLHGDPASRSLYVADWACRRVHVWSRTQAQAETSRTLDR